MVFFAFIYFIYKDVLSGGYRGPEVLAETMATLYTEGRSDVLILDVAAGTGLVGEKVQHWTHSAQLGCFRNYIPEHAEVCRLW